MPLTTDQRLSVSVAFMRCEEMFTLWERHKNELPKKYPKIAEGKATNDIIFQPPMAYFILGNALLFPVLEYLRGEKRSDYTRDKIPLPLSIQPIEEELYEPLREFRNCVFHVQDVALSPRQYAFLSTPDAYLKVGQVKAAVGALLVEIGKQEKNSLQHL